MSSARHKMKRDRQHDVVVRRSVLHEKSVLCGVPDYYHLVCGGGGML